MSLKQVFLYALKVATISIKIFNLRYRSLKIILAKKTTELVLIFHKKTTNLVLIWPNVGYKTIKVLTLYLHNYSIFSRTL